VKVAPLAVILIVVLARARTPKARAMAAACVAAIAAAELIWFNAASSLNAEAPAYYSVLQQPAGADAQALSVLEREIADRHREGERPRIEVVGVSGSWQNLAMARGLEATNGYNPLRIGSYDRLVSPGETTHVVDQRLFPASFDGYDCALARELGLEYVVLGRPIDEVPHLARRPVSDVLMAGPKIWIYRLRRKAESRVKFVKRVSVADADAQVKAGQFRTSPAGETAQVDNDGPARREWPMSTGTEDGGARIVSWRLDRMEVEVDNKQSGILVVHEAYYPGWVAEVDGQPARILRTNVLFRGVEVGEGRHRVVFRFEPFSLSNLRDALLALFGNSP
jgi:Bacterial membrane protein YfhO